jgi:hypothetical protein
MSTPLISRGVGGHQSARSQTDSWLTPPHIITTLGGPDSFDLDPCAFPGWATAKRGICLPDDGLAAEWEGRVWLNPPYGSETFDWLDRLADHGTGTALIFARTETSGFVRAVWRRATALLFIEGRLHFHRPNGVRAVANSGAPSVLVAYGAADAAILRRCSIPGAYVPLAEVES